MKLLARIKQWNKSNAGLTLVEIIVTMLILVVIALPILGGFITAGRANARARDLAYARDAAENVVEVINSSGVSEEVFKELKDDDYWGNYTLKVDPTDENKFSYTIENVRAGTGTYTAVIDCNKSTYQDANDYILPDMSALDSEQTVVVFPESNFYEFDDAGNLKAGSDLHRFDTTAINDFYSDYHDGVVDIYNNVVYASYLTEVRRIEEYNKTVVSPDPTLAPPEIPDYPKVIRKAEDVLTVNITPDDPATTENEAVNEYYEPIKTYIHRTMDIQVAYSPSPDAEDEDGIQATVSTEYVYEMKDKAIDDTLAIMINASFSQYRDATLYGYIDFGALDTAISNLVTHLKESKAYAVVAETTVGTLDNIYLIISPFNAMLQVASEIQVSPYNALSLAVELDGVDELDLKDEFTGQIKHQTNVFLAIQEGEKPYAPGDHFPVKVAEGIAREIFIPYSQMSLQSSDITIEADNTKLYTDKENASGNVLLDVTVKIYEPGNVGTGKELTEVKTTISSKK